MGSFCETNLNESQDDDIKRANKSIFEAKKSQLTPATFMKKRSLPYNDSIFESQLISV
jgi:hypothetical protein